MSEPDEHQSSRVTAADVKWAGPELNFTQLWSDRLLMRVQDAVGCMLGDQCIRGSQELLW